MRLLPITFNKINQAADRTFLRTATTTKSHNLTKIFHHADAAAQKPPNQPKQEAYKHTHQGCEPQTHFDGFTAEGYQQITPVFRGAVKHPGRKSEEQDDK